MFENSIFNFGKDCQQVITTAGKFNDD